MGGVLVSGTSRVIAKMDFRIGNVMELGTITSPSPRPSPLGGCYEIQNTKGQKLGEYANFEKAGFNPTTDRNASVEVAFRAADQAVPDAPAVHAFGATRPCQPSSRRSKLSAGC